MNSKGTKQTVLSKLRAADLSHYTVIEILVGPDSRGPTRCFHCQQTFKPGESWRRIQSPPDPEYGSYFVGIHFQCPTQVA